VYGKVKLTLKIKHSPQRLAWAVLLASFFTCCALTIGVPAAATSFVNNTTYVPVIAVKLQAGRTITFEPPSREADARVVGQDGRTLEEGGTIIVDSDLPSQSLLTIRETEGEGVTDTLLTMQMYSGARLTIERARIPRFSFAATPSEIIIRLDAGRVQVQNGTGSRHPLRVTVRSEHATTLLEKGSYSFEVAPDLTRVFVREGAAQVTSTAKPETFNIEANQRTVVRKGEGVVGGLYAPPRDLIRNGHFRTPFEDDWHPFSQVYVPGEMSGTVRLVGTSPNMALLLDRPGLNLNWGRTGVEQLINENVSGRSSLQLRLNFTILYQELKVCGGQGSECPLMVKISYQNKEGGTNEWTQGFYADGIPKMPERPDEIVQSPPPRTKHIAMRLGTAEPWDSPNLLEVLTDVQTINSIQIYAEGHGVQTQVNSVELLVLD
jgi:hypothetical protein